MEASQHGGSALRSPTPEPLPTPPVGQRVGRNVPRASPPRANHLLGFTRSVTRSAAYQVARSVTRSPAGRGPLGTLPFSHLGLEGLLLLDERDVHLRAALRLHHLVLAGQRAQGALLFGREHRLEVRALRRHRLRLRLARQRLVTAKERFSTRALDSIGGVARTFGKFRGNVRKEPREAKKAPAPRLASSRCAPPAPPSAFPAPPPAPPPWPPSAPSAPRAARAPGAPLTATEPAAAPPPPPPCARRGPRPSRAGVCTSPAGTPDAPPALEPRPDRPGPPRYVKTKTESDDGK
eukprot:1036989-Prorocentrum_minimum.AAC.1